MMKKLHSLIGSLAAVLAIASCTKEAAVETAPKESENLVDVTVEASVPETRVTLDGASPLWTKGDQIGIFTEDLVL